MKTINNLKLKTANTPIYESVHFSATANPYHPTSSKLTLIMSKPDPTISQNMGGINDEAISGEIVDSVL